MIYLDNSEYAKIVSEINSMYAKYKDKRFAFHFSYGIDDKAYIYVFENWGFNEYVFLDRDEIE